MRAVMVTRRSVDTKAALKLREVVVTKEREGRKCLEASCPRSNFRSYSLLGSVTDG